MRPRHLALAVPLLLNWGCSDDPTITTAGAGAGTTATGMGGDIGSGGSPGVGGGPGSGGATSSVGGSGGSGGGEGGQGAGYDGPTRYDHDAVDSPITTSVGNSMRAIAASASGLSDDVFMKVGASGTVSPHFMHCFAPSASYSVDFDGDDSLQPALDYFRGGDAAGDTPFDRVTIAAQVGQSASWPNNGANSPLDQEIAAIAPRFALVNYGTNDMQLGVTHRSALFPFFNNLSDLLDEIEAQGIVPIISGLNPRSDSTVAARWVPTYDVVTRGIAEARQLPYISLYQANVGLPSLGLVSDGIHGNAYSDPSEGSQPCWFTSEAMQFNYNQRNLLTLAALDGARRQVVLDEAAPDPAEPWTGDGSAASPIAIDRLPFTHASDTSASTESNLDGYPACDTGQDESGAEVVYRLELQQETPIRILVLDRAGVDVDVHLLGDTPAASSCVERDDRIIERTLPAGVHHIVVDTFVSGGTPQQGEYLFAVLACESGDPDCT